MSRRYRIPPAGTADRLLLAAITDSRVEQDPLTGRTYLMEGGRAYNVTVRAGRLYDLGWLAWLPDGRGGGVFHTTAAGRAAS